MGVAVLEVGGFDRGSGMHVDGTAVHDPEGQPVSGRVPGGEATAYAEIVAVDLEVVAVYFFLVKSKELASTPRPMNELSVRRMPSTGVTDRLFMAAQEMLSLPARDPPGPPGLSEGAIEPSVLVNELPSGI